MSRFVFETGLEEQVHTRALEALPRAFKRVGELVFVRNYMRYQFGSGEKLTKNNFFVALKSLFLAIKNEELRNAILEDYPEFNEALQRAYQAPDKIREEKGSKEKRKGSAEGKEGFAEFWEAYPNRVGKGNAETAFEKHGCSKILPQILTKLRQLKISDAWTRNGGQYIPHPATWLNRKGWEDEVLKANGRSLNEGLTGKRINVEES